MIGGQTSASAQSAGTGCTKIGATSADATLVCKKTRLNGRSVLRWAIVGSAKATKTPEPPKGPSKKECLVGRWAEKPTSVQSLLRQYAPTLPAQVSGQIVYSFDGSNLSGTGEMVVTSSESGANITGTVRAVEKAFPASYDGIALSMKLAPDSDYPRFFDVSLSVNGTAVSVPTGNAGGPAFFPVSCAGNTSWVTVQTPRGVFVRVLDRLAA